MWCAPHQFDPLAAERTHIVLYVRWFERQVASIYIPCHGLAVLAASSRWLVQTGLDDTTPMACLLLLNGLRVSEVCGIDLDDRTDGPPRRNRWDTRMTRNHVATAVASLAARAGIQRRITPHTLRHAAITAALNAGAHLLDVQDLASRPEDHQALRPQPSRRRRHRPVHRRIR